MAFTKHLALYQKYPVLQMAFQRSDGLLADHGWLDLDFADVKKLQITPFRIHWRPQNDNPYPANISIEAFAQIFSHTTVTRGEKAPVEPPGDGGLMEFGNLEMQSFKEGASGSETSLAKVLFEDIYVDAEGLEEILQNNAFARLHDRGPIRVPVTDIAKWYPGRSPIYSRINWRLKTGHFDPSSVQKNGDAWPAKVVYPYLFSQLVGSPAIDPDSPFWSASIDAPEQIPGDGTPAVEIIQRLLDVYNLQAGKLPNGDYCLKGRLMGGLEPGNVYSAVGTIDEIQDVYYERKGQTLGDVEPAVLVQGRTVIRRQALFYVPIFRDTNGKIYNLEEIGKVWAGYTIEKALEFIFTGHEKAGADIPPFEGPLHFARKEIAQEWFFKGYAPALMFLKSKAGDGGLFGKLYSFLTGAGGVIGLTDRDFDRVDFLPMQETPLYESQLKGLIDSKAPLDSGKEDGGTLLIVDPVVMASCLTQDFFTGFDAVQKRFKAMADQQGKMIAFLEAEIGQTRSKLQKPAEIEPPKLSIWDVKQHNTIFKAGSSITEFLANTFFKKGMDAIAKTAQNLMEVEAFANAQAIERLGKDLLAAEKALKILKDEAKEWAQNFGKLKKTYEKRGAIPCWTNVPPRPQFGGYSLDRETGILKFGKAIVTGRAPFYLDGDVMEGSGPGAVYVVFGREIRSNSILDWTTCLVAEKDGAAEVVGVGVVSPVSPLKIDAPAMRLYEEDKGTRMNLAAVKEQARLKAASSFGDSITADAFSNQYDGFILAVLGGGCNAVQYELDDKGLAYTHVFINHPQGRGVKLLPPLGSKRDASTVNQTVVEGEYKKSEISQP